MPTILCLPPARVDVVSVAWAQWVPPPGARLTPEARTGPVPPSRNFTVPEGVAGRLGGFAHTVAVNVTDCPEVEVVSEEVTAVVVLPFSTAPMSHPTPWGRGAPRWSVAGPTTQAPPPVRGMAFTAGLPFSRPMVWVGPPLDLRTSSLGSTFWRSVPTKPEHPDVFPTRL